MVFRLEDKWQNYRRIKRSVSTAPQVQGVQTPDEDFSMYPALQTSPQEAKLPLPRILRWLGFSSLGVIVLFFIVAPVVVNALESGKESQRAIAAIAEKKDRALLSEEKSVLKAVGQNLGKLATSFIPRAHAAASENAAVAMLNLADDTPGMKSSDLGKADPFAPSLNDYDGIDPLTGEIKQKEVDVLDFIRFTGLIDDDDAGERVVVLEVNDPDMGTYTEVKKMGRSVTLMGKTIRLVAVSGQKLSLTVDGVRRSMDLTPYSDIVVSSSTSVTPPDGYIPPAANGTNVPDDVSKTINQLEEI